MSEYQAKFGHSAGAFVGAVLCILLGEAVKHLFPEWIIAVAFLFGGSAYWTYISIRIATVIISKENTEKKLREQDSERHNLEAMTRFVEVTSAKLPAQPLLQTMAAVFPGIGLESVYVPADTMTTRKSDGFVAVNELPAGVVTDDEAAIWAAWYFGGFRTLGINQWTENEGGTKIFARPRYEKLILPALVKAGYAVKKPGSGEHEFTEAGERWLEGKQR